VDGPVYRVGLTSEITIANWWAALASGANSADRAIFTNTKESMFRLSRPGFVSVPALASSEAPAGVSQRGSVWVAEQRIREDVSWSDGEPLTAGDLVFYFDVVREFDLDGDHAASFPAAVTDVSAPDDHTVRVEFGSAPALTDWQIGVSMAPFVPAHFWDDHLQEARAVADAALADLTDEEARSAVASASLTDADPGNDVTPDAVTPEQIESHRAAVAAEAGRDHLYSVEAPGEPSSGSLILESWDGVDSVSR
jgi:ABC-type transport system substrate-binding protein